MLFRKGLCYTKVPSILIGLMFLLSFPPTPSIAHDRVSSPFSSIAQNAANLTVADIWNNGDASDISIQFEPATENETEYHVIVVKAEQASDFDVSVAESLSTDYLTVIEVSDAHTYQLPSTATDTDGAPIIEDVPYIVYIFSISEGDSTLTASSEITLRNETIVRTLVSELQSGMGGIGVDHEGNVYAGNRTNQDDAEIADIFQIMPDGEMSIYTDQSPGGSGYAFDAEGNLYQANFSFNSITRITPDGEVSEFATGDLRSPVGIVIDEDGTLYVASCGNGSIFQITPDGEIDRLVLDVLLACPNGVDFDDDGSLYISNFTNGNILKRTPDGEISLFAQIPGNNNGHLVYDGDGLFYVIARTANQVYSVTLDGEVELVAGSGEHGHDDGAALDATFSLPNDIKISPDGRVLYLNEVFDSSGADSFPTTIRMIVLVR